MDRRTFVTSAVAASGAFLLPSVAEAWDSLERPDALRRAAWAHTIPESGLYEVVAFVDTPGKQLVRGSIELVRQDGTVLDVATVPMGDRDGYFIVKTRSRFERHERVGLRLPTSYLYDTDVRRLPDHLSGEHYGVYVRDSDRRRAAQKAREVATQFGWTLYLGRDLYTGEYLALSKGAGRVPYRDRHYGEAPIVPRGHYWEKTLIAEGRAPWL